MFSKIFKELREKNNLTQKKLAKQLNVTDRLIRYYETGERMPPADILGKIADYFNVSVDYLLGRTNVKDYGALPIKETSSQYNDNNNLIKDINDLSPESQKELKKLIDLYKLKDMQKRNTEATDDFTNTE